MASSSKEYLETIKAWRFLTCKQLSLLLHHSEKTSQKIISQLLEEKLILELGSVIGSQGIWLQGKWITAKGQPNMLKKKKHRIYVTTSQRFNVPAHNLVTSHATGWILKKLPDAAFIPKSTLRYKYGWRRRQLFKNINLTERDTYLPDAIGVHNKKYFRLEVQLHSVSAGHFSDMIDACQDHFPILVICYPGKREYFLKRMPFYRHRISVVELTDDVGLQNFLDRFNGVYEAPVE